MLQCYIAKQDRQLKLLCYKALYTVKNGGNEGNIMQEDVNVLVFEKRDGGRHLFHSSCFSYSPQFFTSMWHLEKILINIFESSFNS
jgi:hypothetical protein